MTVTTSTARVVHNGNGTTIQFAVPFRFLENGHVAVFLRDAAGGQVQWIENTQYTLTGAGEASLASSSSLFPAKRLNVLGDALLFLNQSRLLLPEFRQS